MLSKILSVSIAIILISSIVIPIFGYAKPVSAQVPSFGDTFTQDNSLNTNLWEVNGPVGNYVFTHIGSPPASIVAPTISFQNGLDMSGVSGTYQAASIQSMQSFSAPFTLTTTVEGTIANGVPFVLGISNQAGTETGYIAGNVNSGNGGYYGIWWGSGTSLGTQQIVSNPSTNVLYNLTISVDSTGSGTFTVSSNGNQLGQVTKQVGTGSFYILLGQFEGLPYTVGPNNAIWQSVQLSSLSGGSTSPVTFTESGLPSGTSWSVTLSGNTQSTTSTSLTFNEPNGNYQFTVNPPASYNVVPYSQSLTVNGSPISQSLTFVPPVQESGSNPVSMSLTGTVSGPITNLQMTLTSGTITAAGTTYPVTGSPGQYCNQNNVVCNSPNGVLSAGNIQLPNGLVLGLASCYTQVSNNQLQLSFYNGHPNTCGGTTAIVQPPSNAFYCPFNATGTLTVSGSQAIITASGTGNCNIPITVTTPSAPTSLTATAVSSSQINLSWNSPTNTGGAPITSYEIQRSISGGPFSVLVSNTGSTSTSYHDTGLSASTQYQYMVSAINSAGAGSSSNTATATTLPNTLQVIAFSGPNNIPFEKQPFNIALTTVNQGNVPLSPASLTIFAEKTYPTQDAGGNPPQLSCSPDTTNQIFPGQTSSTAFQCIATWVYMAPPSFGGTLIDVVENFLTQLPVVGDVIQFINETANNSLQEVNLLTSLYNVLTNANNLPEDLLGTISTLTGFFVHDKATVGVIYFLRLTNNANFQISSLINDMNVTIIAPIQKLVGTVAYFLAEKVAEVISTASYSAATASIGGCATIVGCAIPGLFLAIGVLVEPVTNAIFQSELTDPSADYTQFVQVQPVSPLLVSLQNTTAGKSLYYLSSYVNNLNASAESNARAFGALNNNSTYYAYLQGVKAEQYANDASLYFGNFKFYLNQTLEEINNTGAINQESFNNGQNLVRQNGLPDNLTNILDALGMTQQVNVTKLQIMSFQPLNYTVYTELPDVGKYLTANSRIYLDYLSSLSTVKGPAVAITYPSDGSFSNHKIIGMSGTTEDVSGIQKVTVSIDGNQSSPATLNFGAYSNSTVTWSYTTPPLPDGSHVIIANSTANNGLSSLVSVLVTVDTTPPEAFMQFDPVTKNVILYGTDSLSGMPSNPIAPASVVPAKVDNDNNKHNGDSDKKADRNGADNNNNDEHVKNNAELRTYDIADRAGNTLKLVEKVRVHGDEAKVHIISLQYNNGSVISVGKNEEKFEWSANKTGSINELEQHITVGKDGKRQDIDAKYSSKDNTTVIEVKNQSEHTTKITEPGLVLLHTATNQGNLLVNGY